ncbi:hypothetical protein ACFXJ8_34530 [Nonomuraea sp. NPDC059194]|uniref:hypothetical protein n=1 Tax=Nonomuraea sp. NPDC059194 TaxID=3346764 RepID=UPI0036D07B9D
MSRIFGSDPDAGPKWRCQQIRYAVRVRMSSRLRAGSRWRIAASNALAEGCRSAPLRRLSTGRSPSRTRSVLAGYPVSTSTAVRVSSCRQGATKSAVSVGMPAWAQKSTASGRHSSQVMSWACRLA